jgi:O-antigen/teichoic acid export membrane protein
MLRTLALRTFIVSSANITFGIMTSIMLSRWLGPTQRGEVQAAMLWPILLGYLGSTGMIPATLYFTSLPGTNTTAVLGNTLGYAALQTVAASVLGYTILPLVLASQSPDIVAASRAYLSIIPLILTTRYFLTILQGRMQIAQVNWLRTIVPAGYLVGIPALKLSGSLTLPSIVGLNLALQASLLVVTVVVMRSLGIHFHFRLNMPLASKMWRYAQRVQIGDLAQAVNLRVDQLLIAGCLPPKQLAFYGIAVSCAGLSQALCEAVKMVVSPSIGNKESRQEATALLEAAFRKYWLISVLVVLVLAAGIPGIIPLLLGASFKPAIMPAQVLLLAGLFVGAKDVLSGGAQALGDPSLVSRAELVALVVTVGLLILLLPQMGIMGAAISSAAAYLAQLLTIAHGLRQHHRIALRALFCVRLRDVIALPMELVGAMGKLKAGRA